MRYKLILILFIFGLTSFIEAKPIKWHFDYEKALLKAKKQNKPMMILLRKKNCNNCQKMFEITFLNQDYIKNLNDNYITVIATYEEENNYPIELFYTLDFPALFFISSKDESFLIDPLFGYITPKEFNSFFSSIF